MDSQVNNYKEKKATKFHKLRVNHQRIKSNLIINQTQLYLRVAGFVNWNFSAPVKAMMVSKIPN